MLVDFAAGIMRAIERQANLPDPKGSAEALEAAVGTAVDIDGDTLLALAPESMASVLQVSGTDPAATEYIARSLMLAAAYRADAGNTELAELRAGQARAVAAAYGHDLSDMDISGTENSEEAAEAMKSFIENDDRIEDAM